MAWWTTFQQHRDLYMAPQQRDWTCSICAATWVLQATALDPDAARDDVGYAMGYPACVNEVYGLMSVECMVDLLASYGVPVRWEWAEWDRAHELAASTAGAMSGGAWYHWVAIRGTDGPNLWIANSAEGYKGVWSTLSREQFAALGPFKVVYLVR